MTDLGQIIVPALLGLLLAVLGFAALGYGVFRLFRIVGGSE